MSGGVMCTEHDELTYGCEEDIPGNCPCEDDDCENGPHVYTHVCTRDEFHDGEHWCCCGRRWTSEGETHPEALSAPLPSPGGTHTNPTDSDAPRAAGAAETTQGQQP